MRTTQQISATLPSNMADVPHATVVLPSMEPLAAKQHRTGFRSTSLALPDYYPKLTGRRLSLLVSTRARSPASQLISHLVRLPAASALPVNPPATFLRRMPALRAKVLNQPAKKLLFDATRVYWPYPASRIVRSR